MPKSSSRFEAGSSDPVKNRTASDSGRLEASVWRRRQARAVRLISVTSILFSAGCGGQLGHRSYLEFAGGTSIPAAIRKVRVEVENGTVGILVQPTAEGARIRWKGGIRRAASSAEVLTEIERVAGEFTILADPEDQSILVVRAPRLPTVPSMPDLVLHAVLGVEASLMLPAALPVDLNVTGSGHVVIDGREAAVTATTGRGDMRLTSCRGPARLRSGNGMTIVDDHVGDLDIQAVVGAMQVFVRDPGKSLRLVTRQGDIQCYVPPETSFRVDGRAEIGKVGNGFGLEMRKVGDYSALLTGMRGDGATEIVLRTGSGHLSLNHKVFPPR